MENDDGDFDDDDVERDEFRNDDDLSIVLDQYMGGEELEEPIVEEGNVFDNDLP